MQENGRRTERLLAGDPTLYFGSVRFFKNLILVAVLILILVPTLLAVKFYRQLEQGASAAVGTEQLSESGSGENMFEPEPAAADAGAAEPAEAVPQIAARPAAEPPSADPPSYQALYPDFYAPQPYGATDRVEHTIYLTFDDGPSDRTDEILKILAEKDVKATFFVTGKSDAADLERMKRIVDQGHTIGMHSYSHDYTRVYASVESFLDEFYKNFIQIRDATGVTPTAFRCPGGSINGYDGGFYQELLSEMIRRGFVPYDWNVSSEDAVTSHILPSATLAQNVVRGASGKVRGFVLFHDSEQKISTPAAVAQAIDQLRDTGFAFEAISPSTLPVLYNYTE